MPNVASLVIWASIVFNLFIFLGLSFLLAFQFSVASHNEKSVQLLCLSSTVTL
jgi:hypothetical protein